MKIAYLISAYVDPKQLKRLIESLEYNDECHFYVHIDKKSNINSFKEECKNLKNIYWVEDRIYVSWAGYSQVNAILSMIKLMLDSEIKYDRVISMTGCDYPLWSNEQIHKEFKENLNKQYMIGFNISKSESDGQKRKVNQYWLLDLHIKNRKIVKCISKGFEKTMDILPIRKRVYQKEKNGYDIWYSSDYWALTYECVKKLYYQYINDKNLVRYLKTSFAPSELFMATMVFNSKYKKFATVLNVKKPKGLDKLTALHYIDYSNGIVVFNENDFDRLRKSGKMFARKFNTGKSEKLIKMIDDLRKKESKDENINS